MLREAANPMSCRAAIHDPGSPPGERSARDRRGPALRLDRPHLPPAPAPRELALLRAQGPATRLRRRRDALHARCRRTRRHPESGTRCRASTTCSRISSSPTSRRSTSSCGGEAGTLPAVSWIAPTRPYSEHPPALVSAGQAYVTGLVNAVMRGPDWSSTAIFLAWDDWGGFYDHVVPPGVDSQRLRARVPGARDQPVRAARLRRPPDAELRRLPQVHRGRLPRRPRLDPRTDGRPDPRPDRARERADPRQPRAATSTSTQKPRPPLLLPPHPLPTAIAALPWLKGLLLAGRARHSAAHTAAHA